MYKENIICKFSYFYSTQLSCLNNLCRYRVEWYVTPLHIQRMILFLLTKGNKNFHLSVGRLFIPSLECFATVRSYSVFLNILQYIKSKRNNMVAVDKSFGILFYCHIIYTVTRQIRIKYEHEKT